MRDKAKDRFYSGAPRSILRSSSSGRQASGAISYPDDGLALSALIEDRSFWFRHRRLIIAELVAKYTSSSVVYDLGGGNGSTCEELIRRGIIAVSVEPDPVGCSNASARGVQVVQSTAEEFLECSASNSLNSLLLCDVIEHLPTPHQLLSACAKSLIEDGTVICTVPAYLWLWSNEDLIAGHYQRFTRSSLNKLLVNAGFKIEYSSYLFAPLPLPIFAARTFPYLIGRVFSQSVQQQSFEQLTSQFLTIHNPLARLLDSWLKLERQIIARGYSIPFGSSVLVVARRTH